MLTISPSVSFYTVTMLLSSNSISPFHFVYAGTHTYTHTQISTQCSHFSALLTVLTPLYGDDLRCTSINLLRLADEPFALHSRFGQMRWTWRLTHALSLTDKSSISTPVFQTFFFKQYKYNLRINSWVERGGKCMFAFQFLLKKCLGCNGPCPSVP